MPKFQNLGILEIQWAPSLEEEKGKEDENSDKV